MLFTNPPSNNGDHSCDCRHNIRGGVFMDHLNEHASTTNPRDFWDSLHLDILASNRNIMQEDYMALIERSFTYSMFFKGCHPMELVGFRKILNMKQYGYVLILNMTELPPQGTHDEAVDEFEIYQYLRRQFINKNIYISPFINNKYILLITNDAVMSEDEHREISLVFTDALASSLKEKLPVKVTIGIGSIQPLHSIYTSYIDALSALHYRSSTPIRFYKDVKREALNNQFDYLLAEKHLTEAIRLRKPDAYDYFNLIMDNIRSYSDEVRRNKILELIVLVSHAMSLDNQNDYNYIDYCEISRELMELSQDALIEAAYKHFIFISSYGKSQSNIDYSNHIVMATQEYLEMHYAEDISLEDVAEQVSISPQYFSKLIKKNTGFNFIDWLSMLRVKKAKELLTNSNLTVKEVCFMVGYKDPNYFSRIFKKRIGITPSEYVKNSSYFNNKS
jgi:two-component system, response regulator YesN